MASPFRRSSEARRRDMVPSIREPTSRGWSSMRHLSPSSWCRRSILPATATRRYAPCRRSRDPGETGAYHSVHHYPNNALNPAIEATYSFLETVFGTVADLFPSPLIHVGGDEVAKGAWLGSPRARSLMKTRGWTDIARLQSHFLQRIQAVVTAPRPQDRRLGGSGPGRRHRCGAVLPLCLDRAGERACPRQGRLRRDRDAGHALLSRHRPVP